MNLAKISDISKLRPASSEWGGYYSENGETKMLPFKSFNRFSDNDKKLAMNGLFFLLSKDVRGNNISILESQVNVSVNELESVLLYYLYLVLDELYQDLVCENYFFYESITVNTSSIKGRINFSKSIEKNFSLDHKKVCTYKRIAFSHPVLSLVKEFFHYFSNKFRDLNLLSDDSRKHLDFISAHVENILSEVLPAKDPIASSIALLSGEFDRDHRFFKIISKIHILANYYLDNHYFFNQKSSDRKMNGLVFNLNRPFESLVRETCKAMGLRQLEIKKFTKVKIESNVFQMKPDCWFQLEDGGTMILDVKHKIYSLVNTPLNEQKDSYDLNKLDRNDLYQIISYILTHPSKNKKLRNVYGLIALHEETSYSSSGKYVKFCHDVAVENISERIKVVSVCLGSLLTDLGLYIAKKHESKALVEQQLNYDFSHFFYDFGLQLNEVLGFLEVSMTIKDWVMTLNSPEEFASCITLNDVLKIRGLTGYEVPVENYEIFLNCLKSAIDKEDNNDVFLSSYKIVLDKKNKSKKKKTA